MAVEIETRDVRSKLVRWYFTTLSESNTVESECFLVYGCKWNLEFNSKHVSYCEQTYSITLHNFNNSNLPLIPVTFYIRHEGRDLFQRTNIISGQSTEIWSGNYTDIKQKADTPFAISSVECVLYFHSSLKNSDNPIKVEKSVQTSDPKYPENLPCLENLSLDLSKLVEGDADTDVQLKCGEVSLKAHKSILGARSEVFRAMMQTDMVEGRQGIIEIIDMKPEPFNIFIKYIYTGNLPELTMETALPIYEAADKYQVEALKMKSRQFLANNLSPENALGIFLIADAHSDTDLKDHLIHYINMEKIPSRKEEWLKFCNEYPKLANEVLNYFYDLPKVFW